MNAPAAETARDAAWVVLETPLSALDLAAFCGDLERLYRINPYLEVLSWQPAGPDALRAAARNHSNGQDVRLDARVVRESPLAWRLEFVRGVKRRTCFAIEPLPGGSRLTITDEYAAHEAGAEAAAREVDRSLHAWGVAVKAYLEADRRWGWVPLYRLYRRQVWLPMKPAARRITFLVLVLGAADAALIGLGLAIYWLEAAGPP